MHFKIATVTALVAATAANAIPTSNVRFEHKTIETLEQVCFSQDLQATCINGAEATQFEQKRVHMVCFDKDSTETNDKWNKVRQGERLNLKQFPTTVSQIKLPTMCGEQKVNKQQSGDLRRSNWLPILRKDTQQEQAQKENEQRLSIEKFAKMNKMNKMQENKWIMESNQDLQDQQQQQHQHQQHQYKHEQHVKKTRFDIEGRSFETVDLHTLMRMSNKEYEQYKRDLKSVTDKPEYDSWLSKYETQLALVYTNVLNGWRDDLAEKSLNKEWRVQFEREIQLAAERAYMFLIQQVLVERQYVPRDSNNVPMQPSTESMVKKVWMTVRHELTQEETERVSTQIREYLERLRETKPEIYELKFKWADKLSFEKGSDLNEMTENLLKIAQSGVRLAAQKAHAFNDSAEKHQEWDLNEERSQREEQQIQRWIEKSKTSEGQNEFDEDKDEGMFHKIKYMIRSLEKTIRRN